MDSVEEMALTDAASPISPTRSRGVAELNASKSPESRDRLVNGSSSSSSTMTPTGGVVDEVDPGSGGAEVVEPVALTSTTLDAGSARERAKSPTDRLDTASLRERFVRASSPRVISPSKSEEAEKDSESMEVEGSEQSVLP
jgi:hypothetical protein